MQTKHILMFVAVAVLFGTIISMATSGVFVSAQTNNSNSNTIKPTTDSDFVKQGLIDSDEQGTGDHTGTNDIVGEQEDSQDCTEDDTLEAGATASATTSASESKEGAEDADEAGDNDANDEEDQDTGAEDKGEADDSEENVATTTSADSNAAAGVEEEEDGEEEDDEDQAAFEPCSFSNKIDNPYLPLSMHVGKTLKFEGTSIEDGSSVKVEEFWNVRSETVDIADVETLVVVVQEYADGELVREALQYYAQGIDGAVYNFGEDVADYENGVAVENDEESWTVGDDTSVTGMAMPTTPAIGMGFAFQSVNVPGLAHELSEVTSTSESVSVEQGSFTNVVAVNDYDSNAGKTSQEFYASGVGLIKEVDDDEELELISIE